MILVQAFGEGTKLFGEAGCGVVEVMEMDLYVGGSGAGEFGEGIQKVTLILLLRIEEGEAWRSAICVAGSGIGDTGPALLPGGDAGVGVVEGGVSVWLVVVSDGNPEAFGWAGVDEVADAIAEIGG